MKILVINCGSSSIKYKLYEMDTRAVLAAGGIERVGQEGAFLKTTDHNGEKLQLNFDCPTHTEGIKMMFDTLTHPQYGAIKSIDEIAAAGHRIVAGGSFAESRLVTPDMLEEWKTFMDLAPLHNPPALKGYNAVKAVVEHMPNVFVFDTSFHQTMPAHAYMYAVPYHYYEEMNIRRWGAHGTSHRFVTDRVCHLLGVKPEEQKIITCHIGNGASVSAVDHGKCIDTSMGLTPLEGLMMGTRTGDIDASVVLAIMKKEGKTPDEMQDLLNKKSGLLGISGLGSDMRDVENGVKEGNERAKLALDMYNYRIKKYIGAYAAAMGGVDTIVFTAGVGEHQWDVRYNALKNLEFLGIELDYDKNKANFGEEEIISAPNSRVKVVVVPTDEELLIATDTLNIVSK
ncbi:acetate/propionate family kinase [Alloprevotella sp. oral taxon 473]|uniref:acetate/propionate family kinase n=1 Tax=Alloprevotella sp. oral taxon 473 TaxID=712469 RepID=UPI0002A27833|nr:acetate kinase [Alloprevotella sp. oral taxon 473]EKX92996.1 acetate kinase [Alloprevotella sp. oral taxon 473 str. F0040]